MKETIQIFETGYIIKNNNFKKAGGKKIEICAPNDRTVVGFA